MYGSIFAVEGGKRCCDVEGWECEGKMATSLCRGVKDGGDKKFSVFKNIWNAWHRRSFTPHTQIRTVA